MTQSGREDEVPSIEGRTEELQRIVDLLVRKMEDDFDCTLDYTPRTIAYMDAVLQEVKKEGRGLTPSLFLAIGGYVGETLVRTFDGRWAEGSANLAVELDGDAHTRTLDVFDWVKQSYADPHNENLGQRIDSVLGDGLGHQFGTEHV